MTQPISFQTNSLDPLASAVPNASYAVLEIVSTLQQRLGCVSKTIQLLRVPGTVHSICARSDKEDD